MNKSEKMENISWVIAILSMTGTILNVYKNPVCFAIWLLTNGFWLVYNYRKKQLSQMMIFTMYFLLSIFGLFKWMME